MSRDWVGEYAQSHQHPVNRACHTVGIPMIAVSLPVALAGAFAARPRSTWLFAVAVALFVFGWIFQFVGHAFEHKPPEFLRDPRFLFVGLRWWVAKLRRSEGVSEAKPSGGPRNPEERSDEGPL